MWLLDLIGYWLQNQTNSYSFRIMLMSNHIPNANTEEVALRYLYAYRNTSAAASLTEEDDV